NNTHTVPTMNKINPLLSRRQSSPSPGSFVPSFDPSSYTYPRSKSVSYTSYYQMLANYDNLSFNSSVFNPSLPQLSPFSQSIPTPPPCIRSLTLEGYNISIVHAVQDAAYAFRNTLVYLKANLDLPSIT